MVKGRNGAQAETEPLAKELLRVVGEIKIIAFKHTYGLHEVTEKWTAYRDATSDEAEKQVADMFLYVLDLDRRFADVTALLAEWSVTVANQVLSTVKTTAKEQGRKAGEQKARKLIGDWLGRIEGIAKVEAPDPRQVM